MKVINSELSDKWDENVARALLNLTHNQSGSSGLFDALDQAISFIAARGTDNASVTLFVRNKDDGLSNITLDNLILKAKASNVKINLIWLINDPVNVDASTLRRLASSTGGFSVYMDIILQSNTVFLQLVRLLRMETNFYRVTARITVPPPSFFNQTRFNTKVSVYYYTSKYLTGNNVFFALEKI
jgi:hypothetical protein